MSRTLPWWMRSRPRRCDSCMGGDGMAASAARRRPGNGCRCGIGREGGHGEVAGAVKMPCRASRACNAATPIACDSAHCNDSRQQMARTKNARRLVRQDHRRHPRLHHRQGTARRNHRLGDRSPVRRGHASSARRRSPAARAKRWMRSGDAPGGAGGRADPAELRRAFFEATFQVMGHVAKSDGRVTEQEIGAAREAMQRFSLSEAERQRAIELVHGRQTRGFSARRDPGTALPPGGWAAGPAPPVRADPARGSAARQRA